MRQEIRWGSDLAAAVGKARAAGRPVLVHFRVEGRPFSDEMVEKTLKDGAVTRRVNAGFVPVMLDGGGPRFRDLVGGRAGMATCVVDGTGDVVSVRLGYLGPGDLVRFLDRAVERLPSLEALRRRKGAEVALGEAYLELGSRKRAEECFRRGLEGPDAAAAHERLARLCAMRGRNREAREHLEEARRRDPEGRLADRMLVTEVLASTIERRHPEALGLIGRARPGNPETDQLMLLKAVCLHDSGKPEEALAVLRKMVRDFPDSAHAPEARRRIEHLVNPPPGHVH